MAKAKSSDKKAANKKSGFKAPVNTKTGEAGDRAASTKADKVDPKKKPGDGPADNPKAVTGDNILTEDQTRALFFNHLKAVKAANADVAEAEVVLRAAKKSLNDIKKLAKSEGTSLTDIDTALRFEDGDEKVMRAEIENRIKIARWLNIPLGFQVDFLDQDRRPAVDRAFEEGKIAGLKGAARKPPHDPSTKQYTRWMEGHSEGQAVLSQKFKPLEKTDVPQGSKPTEKVADKAKPEGASDPKNEAPGDQKAAPESDKAGGPAPGAAGAVQDKAAETGAATAKPKTPPVPPADDTNVVSLQTGGKKTG